MSCKSKHRRYEWSKAKDMKKLAAKWDKRLGTNKGRPIRPIPPAGSTSIIPPPTPVTTKKAVATLEQTIAECKVEELRAIQTTSRLHNIRGALAEGLATFIAGGE